MYVMCVRVGVHVCDVCVCVCVCVCVYAQEPSNKGDSDYQRLVIIVSCPDPTYKGRWSGHTSPNPWARFRI